ncbi:MAG: EAL domain-containing protein [Parvibaculaceae bacterium]
MPNKRVQDRRKSRGKIEYWVAFLAGIALIATIIVVYSALHQLARAVDQTDAALTRQTAQAAVKSFVRQLTSGHADYARWDDAAEALYNTPNADFAKSNFQDSTAIETVFDTTFLIDEHGKDLFAFRLGEVLKENSADYLGPGFALLLRDAPVLKSGEYKSTSGILNTKDGIAAVVVGQVVPYNENLTMPEGQRRLLVIARHLNAKNLATLREEFVIPGFDLVSEAQKDGHGIEIRDPTGAQIGTVTWTRHKNGSTALARITPMVYSMLGALAIVMGGIVIVAWSNLRNTMDSRASAEHAAMHDFLTGLPNRNALLAMPIEKVEGLRLHPNVAVAFLDLDGFKEVNDTHGHAVGDRALRACAAGFQFIASGKGTLARVGGDEFAFVTTGPNAPKVAADVGQQFIDFLNDPIETGEGDARLGTSVGIACANAESVTVEELLRRADIAMYEAKKIGGNRIAHYDAKIDARLQERAALTAALRDALAKGEVTVVYQLVVDAKNYRPVGVEALARWVTWDGRQIAPDVFIGLAEEGGLIDELGTQVLRRACRDLAPWPHLMLAVNVSPIQFRNPHFEEIVAGVLLDTQFPAHRLELEFTERNLLNEPEEALTAMRKLKAFGISIALDDFGTGYSSIGYLRSFPFDRLKIDRTICADVTLSPEVQQLIQGTIAIARSMGLKVTAEGVQDEHQASLLRLAGCEYLQGFFFEKPLTIRDLAAGLNSLGSVAREVS